jgi:hypothetical protein
MFEIINCFLTVNLRYLYDSEMFLKGSEITPYFSIFRVNSRDRNP